MRLLVFSFSQNLRLYFYVVYSHILVLVSFFRHFSILPICHQKMLFSSSCFWKQILHMAYSPLHFCFTQTVQLRLKVLPLPVLLSASSFILIRYYSGISFDFIEIS